MGERLVVIGGDAAGMSAASQARRRRDDLEIVALERGTRTSYSACGIPYYVGGQIDDADDLIARTPQEFRDGLRIDVRLRHEAMGIDLDAGQIEVRDLERERTITLGYDQLMIATGGQPVRPDLPGVDLDFVRGVQTVDDGIELLRRADDGDVERVVVVGGGYIGLEMAEAFVRWGADVTVVESSPHILGTLDPDIASLVESAMRRHDIELQTSNPVTGFSEGAVETAEGPIGADLVVLGLGVEPNSRLAVDAGLETGPEDAVHVNRRQQTSHEGVWSAGDCSDVRHLVTGEPTYVALGTVANKAGRVAGINIGGGYADFPGVVGTAVTKLCSTEVGRTGLNEREAKEAGFEYEVVSIESTTRAGYLDSARPITVKLLAERGDGRLLGAQIVGEEGAAKRIDIAACALTAGMTAQDLVDLDLGYAPPFSPLWDPIAVAARKALRAFGRPA
jgi:NADPH-dependent 2,4-dienoyl-CoA reductase/sulfur reductase-like enzyme